MSKRIVFMGAGAVGGYVGGHFARIGEDVTLIDPWPEHVVKRVERGEIDAPPRNVEKL